MFTYLDNLIIRFSKALSVDNIFWFETNDYAILICMYTSIASDIAKFNAYGLLPELLIDHATGDNIRWSTDAYASLHDHGYAAEDQIEPIVLLNMEDNIVRIRAEKEQDLKADRTKQRAEVFTPRWVCSYMIDELDLAWLEENGIEIENASSNEKDDFEENVTCATGSETPSEAWSEPLEYWYLPFENDEPEDEDRTEADSDKAKSDGHELSENYESRVDFSKINMKSKGLWKKYVSLRKMEITCGEAPYIVTRYDAATGEPVDIEKRTGMLDRKLSVIGQYAKDEAEWFRYAKKALKTTYGYEYQGDNLLIARINVVASVGEFFENRWGHNLDPKQYKQVIEIVSWNLWQMNGLTGMTPCGALVSESMFDESLFFDDVTDDDDKTVESSPCKVRMWSGKKKIEDIIEFRDIGEDDGLEEGEEPKMKFDYVIGNPPYQSEAQGTSQKDPSIYHLFYDAVFDISDRVMLISPARFLSNAGDTPKEWNDKMLNDPHIQLKQFWQKSDEVFKGTDIKGGVAVIYRDITKEYDPIGIFTPYAELNSILKKVSSKTEHSLMEVITNRGLYRYSDKAYNEEPEELKKTADRRIAPSAFERMPKIFTKDKPNNGYDYIQIYGNIKSQRMYRWIRKDYVSEVGNLNKYKVLIPKANGSGAIGEVLSTPLVGSPLVGFTETYISIGETDSLDEAEATLKYVKSKFARTMLGILKVTQNNARPAWKYVPLQDFTSSSDIDWTKSIHEIDQQLYKKYGLSQEEIDFIEEKVRSMEDDDSVAEAED